MLSQHGAWSAFISGELMQPWVQYEAKCKNTNLTLISIVWYFIPRFDSVKQESSSCGTCFSLSFPTRSALLIEKYTTQTVLFVTDVEKYKMMDSTLTLTQNKMYLLHIFECLFYFLRRWCIWHHQLSQPNFVTLQSLKLLKLGPVF